MNNNWDVILSKQSIIQDKIHFLLTQRKYKNIKNGIKSELNRIKNKAKKFYRKTSYFEKIKREVKKIFSKYLDRF